jgi:hypothetical protein
MDATHDALVKSDRRGRLRYAPEQKAAILDAFASSGLSGPKFAALHGVKYQTFAAWVQKRKQPGGTTARGATVANGIGSGACRGGDFLLLLRKPRSS